MEPKKLVNNFEAQAEKLLKYLRKDIRYDRNFIPRPFFVEFTGSPDSGKTTSINELYKFLHRHGFKVYKPQEGAEAIAHIPRITPEYNIATANYALRMIHDFSYGNTYDVVIFDRALFDSYAWMEYWFKKGQLTEEEKINKQKFFLSRLWIHRIDVAYIVTCEAKVAVSRGKRIALSDKLGETSSEESIRSIAKIYTDAYEILKPNYPQLYLVDTTFLGEEEMVKMLAKNTFDVIEAKIERESILKNQNPQ